MIPPVARIHILSRPVDVILLPECNIGLCRGVLDDKHNTEPEPVCRRDTGIVGVISKDIETCFLKIVQITRRIVPSHHCTLLRCKLRDSTTHRGKPVSNRLGVSRLPGI